MTRSTRWATATIVFALGAVYSLLNVWAAVDLGYDAHPGGKDIIQRWVWLFLACVALSFVAAIAAWRARRPEAPSG